MLRKRVLFVFVSLAMVLVGFVGAKPVSAAPTISNPSLPAATVNQAYSYQLQAANGFPPYTFEKWYTTYPGSDMTLSSTGLLSGTPHTAGTFEYGIHITDTVNGAYGILTFVVNGSSSSGALAITTTSMPNGTAGQNYSFQFQATGGTGTYNWQVVSTTHPCCYVGINSTTGVFGSVSGSGTTPPLAGTWNVGIKVTDSSGNTATQTYTWVVTSASGATIVSIGNVQPAGGSIAPGSNNTVTWTAYNLTTTVPTIISLQSVDINGVHREEYRISSNANSSNGNNTFSWVVPTTISTTVNYKIVVQLNQLFSDGNGGSTFPKGESTGLISIATATTGNSSLAVTVDSGSASGSVFAGAPNYDLATFRLTASGSPVTITSFQVVSDSTNAATAISSLNVLRDNSQGLSSISSLTGVNGSIRFATVTLATPMTINVGQTALIDVTANVASTATGSIRLGLSGFQFSSNNTTVSSTLPVYANTIQIGGSNTANPTVTITRDNSIPTSFTIAPGQANANLVGVVISATNGDAYVNSITFGMNGTIGLSRFGNLRAVLSNGNSLLVDTNGTVTFTPAILIQKDSSLTFKFIGTPNTDTANNNIQPKFVSAWIKNSQGGNISANATDISSIVTISGTAVNGLTITSPDTLPDATVGQNYTYQFTVSGGSTPYTWSFIPGTTNTYPCCYTTLSSTGVLSAVSGSAGYMPYSGTYSVGVRVTDNTGATKDKTVQLNVKTGTTTAQVAEGFVDVANGTQVLGWAFNSTANDNRQAGTVQVTYENVANTSQTFVLSLTPSLTRPDVTSYLQTNRGVTSVNIPTGFSGDPRTVLTQSGVYRVRSATYNGVALKVSDVAKRSFAIGNAVVPTTTSKYVKVEGDSTVYWITAWGGKMPMLTEKIFLSYGAKFSDVVTITQEELDNYDDVTYIKLQGNARVYKLENFVKRYLTPAAATRLNVDPAKVVTVNSTEFYTYRTGSTIQ